MKRLFVSIVSFVVLVAACSSASHTGTGDELSLYHVLSSGAHQALSAHALDESDLSALRTRDPRMSYALVRALLDAGMPSAALRVTRFELSAANDPWAGYAAAEVAADLTARRRWEDIRAFVPQALPRAPFAGDLWYAMAAALYEQRAYGELIDHLAQLNEFLLDHGRFSAADLRTERLVWEAVATFQVGTGQGASDTSSVANAASRFLRAFVAEPAGPIHRRLYLYMLNNAVLLRALSVQEQRLVEAVYRTAIEDWAEATRLFGLLDIDTAVQIIERYGGSAAAVARSARVAYEGANRHEAGALRVQGLAERLPVAGATQVWGDAAALRAAAENPAAARALLDAVLERGGLSVADRSALLVHWRAHTAGMEIEALVERLARERVGDAVFAVTIERNLAPIVAARDFERIAALWELVPESARDARLHLATVLSAAQREGMLARQVVDAHTLGRLADAAPAGDYNRLIASTLLGAPPELWRAGSAERPQEGATNRTGGSAPADGDGRPGGSGSADTTPTPDATERAETARWERAEALLAAGITRGEFTAVWRLADNPRWSDRALDFARAMAGRGDTSGALDMARRAVARAGTGFSIEDALILYPTAYRDEIVATAQAAGIEPALFFALVREESHFSPTARSWVGATGLSQLMSATAADMASRLGLREPVLTDPWTNLYIGTQYLAYLDGLVPHRLLAIAGYNAGLGRARTWNTQFGDLPAILLIEAIPFHETRNYLRKIVTSWVYYRNRLTDAAAQETLNEIVAIRRME